MARNAKHGRKDRIEWGKKRKTVKTDQTSTCRKVMKSSTNPSSRDPKHPELLIMQDAVSRQKSKRMEKHKRIKNKIENKRNKSTHAQTNEELKNASSVYADMGIYQRLVPSWIPFCGK